jgi:hypothetical protein
MIYEFRQQNSGNVGQSGMPLVIYIFAQYAFEANKKLQQLDGYFGRREGDCPEPGDECCGDRWEPVEQADGFLDEEIQEIAKQHLVNGKTLWKSNTFINEEPYDGIEEFWVAIAE